MASAASASLANGSKEALKFFTVRLIHVTGPKWGEHVKPHCKWLEDQVAAGNLKASGPIEHKERKSGFLIFKVKDRETVEKIVASDPFDIEGVNHSVEILEWDPVFGAFESESSGKKPSV